jgi:hypothetical protein
LVVQARSPSDSWKETTWRASAEYDVTPTSLLYGAVETGFKAGGFFFTNDDPAYQPEMLTAYSIGFSDTTVVQGTFPGPLAGFALTAATLRPPRNFGARLTVKF